MKREKGKTEDKKDRNGGDEGHLCTFTDQRKHRYRCHTTKKMRLDRITKIVVTCG